VSAPARAHEQDARDALLGGLLVRGLAGITPDCTHIHTHIHIYTHTHIRQGVRE
jgi:hypothetical protein